jgi:hypothetical protein
LVTEALKGAALLLMAFCMISVPYAVGLHIRPRRTQWLLVGFEGLVVGYAARIIDHWASPIKWYGTPTAIASVLCLAVYVAWAVTDYRKEQK